MQRGGSRSGHSKNDSLKAGFLHAQLSNADLIKKLKVVVTHTTFLRSAIFPHMRSAVPNTGSNRDARRVW